MIRIRTSLVLVVSLSAILVIAGVVIAGDGPKGRSGADVIPDGVDDGVALPDPQLPTGPSTQVPPGLQDLGSDSPPAGAVELSLPKPKADLSADVALGTYLLSQRERLMGLTVSGRQLAAVTFRRGLSVAEAVAVTSKARAEIEYFEWQLPNAPDHGGAIWELLPSVQAEHPDIEITYISTIAQPTTLKALQASPVVWLVDVGGSSNGTSNPLVGTIADLPRNYFADARKEGLLDD